MTNLDKIRELRTIIKRTLLPIMGKRVILVDAPYYNNIGDVLIWAGTEDFIRQNNIDLISTHSIGTFIFPEIESDVTILLTGGGNFGDLYRWAQNMRLKVIERYPRNRIIMLPQSVWYDDKTLIEKDAAIIAQHHELYLCARDNWSLDFFKTHFSKNRIISVPDMAFCIDDAKLIRYRGQEENKKLFFRRLDQEVTATTPDNIADYEVHDWPVIENKPVVYSAIRASWIVARKLPKNKKILSLIDRVAKKYMGTSMVNIGCKFLAPYSQVTTTRLHALILSILLDKPVRYIDNSTGKLSAFVDSWLGGLSTLTRYE